MMFILCVMLHSLCSFKVFRKKKCAIKNVFIAEQIIKLFFCNTVQISESCLQRCI